LFRPQAFTIEGLKYAIASQQHHTNTFSDKWLFKTFLPDEEFVGLMKQNVFPEQDN
jgi:hypothetical protein